MGTLRKLKTLGFIIGVALGYAAVLVAGTKIIKWAWMN